MFEWSLQKVQGVVKPQPFRNVNVFVYTYKTISLHRGFVSMLVCSCLGLALLVLAKYSHVALPVRPDLPAIHALLTEKKI
jgi:hypothetical protein